jgi:hypothetical protein
LSFLDKIEVSGLGLVVVPVLETLLNWEEEDIARVGRSVKSGILLQSWTTTAHLLSISMGPAFALNSMVEWPNT